MITDAQLRTLARKDGVTAGLAEKNYVNSWILYTLYDSQLGDDLVFKGGTALSKLYFPEIWRFSEDLDFTVAQPVPGLDVRLGEALDGIESQSGITFDLRNIHRAGDSPVEYVQVKVQYEAVLGHRNTTKLDLDFTEGLAFPVQTHRHDFEDVPGFELSAYSIEEILVEKLRSLFQRARARDYYDIYRLLAQHSFDDPKIAEALTEKSREQDVSIDLENGIPDDDIDDVRAYWDRALDRLVQSKPPFDEVVDSIDEYLRQLETLR